jgi:hypothetical protein
LEVNAQLVPELHEQDAPEHVGAGALVELPHAPSTVTTTIVRTIRIDDFRSRARISSSATWLVV